MTGILNFVSLVETEEVEKGILESLDSSVGSFIVMMTIVVLLAVVFFHEFKRKEHWKVDFTTGELEYDGRKYDALHIDRVIYRADDVLVFYYRNKTIVTVWANKKEAEMIRSWAKEYSINFYTMQKLSQERRYGGGGFNGQRF